VKRPLPHWACRVSVLAIASFTALTYLPLTRIEAAPVGTPKVSAAQKSLVNFGSRQTAQFIYTGSAAAVAALRSGAAHATALAAADFNADGAMDVVAGYSTSSGGVLALLQGNPDAYAPKDLSWYKKAAQGSVPSTFLSKARVVAVPESPDLLVTGDFNRDGRKDVLVASRGGALYFLAGDGHGNLAAPEAVPLSGQVTALAVAGDAHVAVSLEGSQGPQLVLLTPSAHGLIPSATFSLPERGDAVAWGSLGGAGDVAVGAGAHVVMIYNAVGANPQTETVSLPFQVAALAVGDFIWDRDGRTEISVLASDGSIHILQHGTLNTTALTAADLPARRAALRGRHKQSSTILNPTALGAWTVAREVPYTGSAPSQAVAPSAFSSPRLAAAPTQDLMVLDGERRALTILDTSGAAARPSASLALSATPVAALALPQKVNAARDIIVLTSSQSAPTLIAFTPGLTFTVTTTSDEDPDNACNVSTVTSASGALSLREAVCLANNNAPATSTINLGPGTYDLTSLESGEIQIGNSTSGYSLSIVGTGTTANTIIQQTDGVDRIFEEDYHTIGNNPLSISNVTLTGGYCTNNTTNDCTYGGGAVLAGSFVGDDLTITNVVMSGNEANPSGGQAGGGQDNGGALNFGSPNLTITNSTFSGNTASGPGGGVYFEDDSLTSTVNVTNSTFTGNTSGIEGGGFYMQLEPGLTTATFSGSTFSMNNAQGGAGGGGIYTVQGGSTSAAFTVSNSRFDGTNKAAKGGTALSVNTGTVATLTDNWWGCNAGPDASGCDTIYVEPPQAGNPTSEGNYNPWLVLGISASPTQISVDGTSTLTADLTHDSNNNSGFSVPDGTGVTFGGTLGSENPTAATTTSGQADSTFTAATTGTGSGTAKVDQQTVSVAINIGQSPSITSASHTTFLVGKAGSFTVTTNGTPTASINDGGATLPGGVTFVDNGNGTATLAGTPAGGSLGSYPMTLTAQNGFTPNATQGFTLYVNQLSFTVSPSMLAFGSEQTNVASASMPLTVTNTGNEPLPITGIARSGPDGEQFTQTNNCNTPVPVGSFCTINVVFTPTTLGSITATLSVSRGRNELQSVTLSGTGTTTYTLSPSQLAFGNEPKGVASASRPLTVTNTGNVPLPITGIARSGPDVGQFTQTNNCNTPVPVGSFCTINVVFTPASRGSKTATLSVNSKGYGLQSVTLMGTGT